jgi:hypothetical protein
MSQWWHRYGDPLRSVQIVTSDAVRCDTDGTLRKSVKTICDHFSLVQSRLIFGYCRPHAAPQPKMSISFPAWGPTARWRIKNWDQRPLPAEGKIRWPFVPDRPVLTSVVIASNTSALVVLYGCETWSLILKEEHRLRVWRAGFRASDTGINRMLEKIV